MMNNKFQTVFSGQNYGTRVTVELDRADIDLNEYFEAFKTILIGLSWSESQIEDWILEKAEVIKEQKAEHGK
jgi:hypothetical protein